MTLRSLITATLLITATGCDFSKGDLGDDENDWGDAADWDGSSDSPWDGGGEDTTGSGSTSGGEAGGSDESSGSGGSGSASTGGTTGSTGDVYIDATIEILTPESGTVVTDPWVEVTFSVDGCTMSRPDSNPDGCHLHRTINGMVYEDPETIPEDDRTGQNHYSMDPMLMHMGEPGGKNIRIVLVRNDGTDLPYVPQISDTISIIRSAEADTGSPDTGDPDTGEVDTGGTDTAHDGGEIEALEVSSWSLEGHTFLLDLTDSDWTDPPGVGPLFTTYFTSGFLIDIESIDDDYLRLRHARGYMDEALGRWRQDFGRETHLLDWLSFSPTTPRFTARRDYIESTWGPLHGLEIETTIAPEGDRLLNTEMSFTVETSLLGGMMGLGSDPDVFCDYVSIAGIAPCELCPDFSSDRCLSVEIGLEESEHLSYLTIEDCCR